MARPRPDVRPRAHRRPGPPGGVRAGRGDRRAGLRDDVPLPGDEIAGLLAAGPHFFKPDWAADVVGLRLDADTDWTEVAELLTESYCVLAPKKLVALVDRPG